MPFLTRLATTGMNFRDRSGQDTRSLHGPDAEPLDALSDTGLSDVGALRFLSGQRGLRFSRSASGWHGPCPGKTSHHERAPASALRPVNLSREMSSTGGCLPMVREFVPAFQTIVLLAYATAHYVKTTGDIGILDEKLPFLEGQALQPGEHDAFFHPRTSDETKTLYDHCALGLKQSLKVGKMALPLIGTGDWNDGIKICVREKGQKGKVSGLAGFYIRHSLHLFPWRLHATNTSVPKNGLPMPTP